MSIQDLETELKGLGFNKIQAEFIIALCVVPEERIEDIISTNKYSVMGGLDLDTTEYLLGKRTNSNTTCQWLFYLTDIQHEKFDDIIKRLQHSICFISGEA